MMIPKSVSGSTRIVALAAVMLIPACGWAGEFEQQFMVQDSDGTELLRCDEQAKHCYGPLLEQNTCYQRMREAMQWANDLENIRSGELFLEPRNRTAKWYFDGKKQFDQTYKDCVEGR